MPSPRAQKRSCIELGVLVTNRARLNEYVAGGLIRRASGLEEIVVVAYRLLE